MSRRKPATAETLAQLAARWGVTEETAALFAPKAAAPIIDRDVKPANISQRKRRLFRGGARVRELRQALRLTRLMLARQQAARGAGGLRLHLIGGRQQLRERLADLPGVGNPYASIPGKGRAS